jgi:hypothetical protein
MNFPVFGGFVDMREFYNQPGSGRAIAVDEFDMGPEMGFTESAVPVIAPLAVFDRFFAGPDRVEELAVETEIK